MKIKITNISARHISTDMGLLAPGEARLVEGVTPDRCHTMAQSLNTFVENSFIKLEVTDDSDRLDALEPVFINSEGSVQFKTVFITSAEILMLYAGHIDILPSPGKNLMYVFEGATMYYRHNTTPYARPGGQEHLSIAYNSAGPEVARVDTHDFIDLPADAVRYVRHNTAIGGVNDIAPVLNAPLVLKMTQGDLTGGDGDLYIKCYYRVVPYDITGL